MDLQVNIVEDGLILFGQVEEGLIGEEDNEDADSQYYEYKGSA
jgi:hypothetical protein